MRLTALCMCWGLGLPSLLPAFGAAQDAERVYRELLEAYEADRQPAVFAARFLQFADDHQSDPRAIDALVWVVANRRYRPEAAQAIERLEVRHLESEQLADVCRELSRVVSRDSERLLRSLSTQSQHERVRANASYYLTTLLAEQSRLASELAKDPRAKPRVQQYYGKQLTEHLATIDAAKLEAEREQLFELIVKRYGQMPTPDGPIGKIAERALFAIRHLAVGKRAPEIDAEDIDGKRFKLSDYRGKVVLLSFWGHW